MFSCFRYALNVQLGRFTKRWESIGLIAEANFPDNLAAARLVGLKQMLLLFHLALARGRPILLRLLLTFWHLGWGIQYAAVSWAGRFTAAPGPGPAPGKLG